MEFKKQNILTNLKKKREKPKNRPLTIENKLMVTRGEVGGGMGEISDGDLRVHIITLSTE